MKEIPNKPSDLNVSSKCQRLAWSCMTLNQITTARAYFRLYEKRYFSRIGEKITFDAILQLKEFQIKKQFLIEKRKNNGQQV